MKGKTSENRQARHTAQELVDFLKKEIPQFETLNNTLVINGVTFKFDIANNKFEIAGLHCVRKTSLDLTKYENHSVCMLLIKLISKGYALENITLEKSWQTGHSPIYLDLMLKNPANGDVYMIDAKSFEEYAKYTNVDNEKEIKQLCSYVMQETNTILASFYTYDFSTKTDRFSNIYCKELRKEALNVDDFYDRWNKVFDENDYIEQQPIFNIHKSVKKYNDLKKIEEKDTKKLFNQFLTILRINSISDKPTAFMKMINLFLTKLADEVSQDRKFSIVDSNENLFSYEGVRFQYIEDEKPESFMKRLNELYKEGMKTYLKKEVLDYSDTDIQQALGNCNNALILKMFDDIRLKKDINFNFIEVYDEDTFQENYTVVRDVVKLLEIYKFKYNTKYQFLGDFFEELLNTSLKQEAGQFFTPYPLVDFMVYSLDVEHRIQQGLENGEADFVPKVIDYACGAGHFLISSMMNIQSILQKKYTEQNTKLTETQKDKLEQYANHPFCWADTSTIVGIEKDYRLAKTTKIATFLNGDGKAEIISGDGINRFDCAEYAQTILHSKSSVNPIFDYVVSNPPYSVEGFMLNFRKNKIDKQSNTFTLLKENINIKDTAIETYFVERTWQLLKDGGIGAIILPQSILSQSKYEKMRRFMLANFRVVCMLLTADITFSGTTTSPVILFLKKEHIGDFNYDVLIHMSPKYARPTGGKMKNKEIHFLGYEFSSDRNKSGIKILPTKSILSELIPYTRKFIEGSSVTIPLTLKDYSRVVNLQEILVNETEKYIGDIYPKRERNEGRPLKCYCQINNWEEIDFAKDGVPSKYLEISDMEKQESTKNKRTKRYCKKGDILVSSLCPSSSKIVIAKENFMVSNAIHVLSEFNSDEERDRLYELLKTEPILKQMNAMLDGFKVTYGKISENNLYNNILL